MPKNSVADWDTTAANNTDIGGIGIAEGCDPGNINDAIRELMEQLKTYLYGGQLKFPATQVPSADANTLDDYEEGTWTPVVSAQAGTITSATATGRYTKIGRMVFSTAEITITAAGTASAGLIYTLPIPLAAGSWAGVGRETTVGALMFTIAGAGPASTIFRFDNTTPITTGANIRISLTYEAAS